MPAVRIDLVASLPHYEHHLRPIWDALPEDVRGQIRIGSEAGHTPPRNHVAMVASWRDMHPLQGLTKFVYVEHGSGQSYGGDYKSAHWPDYSASAGSRHRDVLAYICPSHRVAKLWNHPAAFAVGCPRLDALLSQPESERSKISRSVCFTFHWPCKVAPEADTAFWHFLPGLKAAVSAFKDQGWTVMSHVHPKWEGQIDEMLRTAGISLASNSALVAEVLICDNSSTMYEMAAIGRHVIALNAPTYRRAIHHGLRFWDAVPGFQIDNPDDLAHVDLDSVITNPLSEHLAKTAAEYAYSYLDGHSAQRAVDAILVTID